MDDPQDTQAPIPVESDTWDDCFECGSKIVEGKCPYCSKPVPVEIGKEEYALYIEKQFPAPTPVPPSSAPGRQSPWYTAKEELRTVMPVPPFTALIANLTPHREYVRLGVLINGRESSITVPFELATQFMDQVQALIKEKGAR